VNKEAKRTEMERMGCKRMGGGREKVRYLPLFRIQTSEVNNVILDFHSGAFGFFVRDSVQRLCKRMTLAGESAVAVIMVMPPGTEPSTHWLHVYTARCYIGVEEWKKKTRSIIDSDIKLAFALKKSTAP